LPDIVDAAIASGMFDVFVKSVIVAELVDTLKSPGPFTVFAPTDDAFAQIPKNDFDMLLRDKVILKEVLTFHVVEGKLMAADLAKREYLQAVSGGELRIDAKRWHLHSKMKVNGATLVKPDLVVDNGVCHAIDKVLMPKKAVASGQK